MFRYVKIGGYKVSAVNILLYFDVLLMLLLLL